MIVSSPLRKIRILLAVDIALIAVAIVYAIKQPDTGTITSTWSFTIIAAAVGLVARAGGWIGLWFNKKWGLIAFALSAALFIAAQEPDPSTTRWAIILDEAETLTAGIMLGLAFFGFPDGYAGANRRAIGDAFS